jgi:hypothetical protein
MSTRVCGHVHGHSTVFQKGATNQIDRASKQIISGSIDLGKTAADMGGSGSGFQGIRADAVEDCLVLSIAELRRQKVLVPGSLRRCNWSWPNEPGQQATIQIEADLRDEVHAAVRLRYVGAGEPIDTWIFLAATEPRFGGRRWWFKCPATGQRVGKLYLPPGERRFGSRAAYGLSYRSCQAGEGMGGGLHQRLAGYRDLGSYKA